MSKLFPKPKLGMVIVHKNSTIESMIISLTNNEIKSETNECTHFHFNINDWKNIRVLDDGKGRKLKGFAIKRIEKGLIERWVSNYISSDTLYECTTYYDNSNKKLFETYVQALIAKNDILKYEPTRGIKFTILAIYTKPKEYFIPSKTYTEVQYMGDPLILAPNEKALYIADGGNDQIWILRKSGGYHLMNRNLFKII